MLVYKTLNFGVGEISEYEFKWNKSSGNSGLATVSVTVRISYVQ